MLEVVEDLFGGQVVQSWHAFGHVALHGESFSWTGLAVSEAGNLGTFEGTVNKGPDGLIINLLIVGLFIEGVIEVESGLFDVLGEIDFLSMNK